MSLVAVILAAVCPALRPRLLSPKTSDLLDLGCNPNAIEKLLHFAYSGTLSFRDGDVDHLEALANDLGMGQVKEILFNEITCKICRLGDDNDKGTDITDSSRLVATGCARQLAPFLTL